MWKTPFIFFVMRTFLIFSIVIFVIMYSIGLSSGATCNVNGRPCCVGTFCCGCQENLTDSDPNPCLPVCVKPTFALGSVDDLLTKPNPIPSYVVSPVCGQTYAQILSQPSCFVDDVIRPVNQSTSGDGSGWTYYLTNTNPVCEYYKTLVNRYIHGVCTTQLTTFCIERIKTLLLAKQADTSCTTMTQYLTWANGLKTSDSQLNTFCNVPNVLPNYNVGTNYGVNCVDFLV